MGGYKRFACRYCDYTEDHIPIGRSAQGSELVLFVCRHCRSYGSLWRMPHAERDPVCSYCYDRDLQYVNPAPELECPKCGETGILSDVDGGWE